jgi:hypothetical protein
MFKNFDLTNKENVLKNIPINICKLHITCVNSFVNCILHV